MELVRLENLLDNASFGLLFGAMLIYWLSVAFSEWNWLRSLGSGIMVIANITVATLLTARWIEAGYFPLSNLYESLFFIAWGITAMHLLVEQMGKRSSHSAKTKSLVGAFTAPLAMGITAFAALVLPENMRLSEPLVPALKSNWLMMHVSVMLFSYAALMVGSLLAISFLIVTQGQEVALQGNSWGRFMPSSGNRLDLGQTLDNLSYRLIGIGFPLLTIGIIAGAVWANEAWGSYWSWDPKETWSLITWLVFAAYLHTRITKGWQGKRPAILASLGLGVVWICYLGVNLLGKGLHSYGWFL
ncbi:MAG: c-type cytochrome biogenesis protein CcsB [Pseudanabaenaceae cyanobacterium bins.68]|nr:c-type cytochrome biogenesis protein CcsB [Pseudanabaenaceae cyanobacterium bins.68]